MSKIEVDQVDPQSGTTLTLGTSGDTVSIPSGVTLANAGTVTGIPASAISSGTLADARIPDLNASKITAGTIATARLGSGTASSSTFLRGDQTYAAAGGGKVLQVVSDTLTAEYTTGSTSFSDTGLTLNITPSATSSKILIMMQGTAYSNTAGTRFILTLLRDSTNLATGDSSGDYGFYSLKILGASQNVSGSSIILLDSPSSSSSLTYKVQGRLDTASGAGQLSLNATTSTLIAMEIGA